MDSTKLRTTNANSDEKLEYILFWNSSDDQWEITEKENWMEYPFHIQEYLNIKYNEFLKGKEAVVKLIAPLEDYQIDFQSFLQINIRKPQNIRLIKIEKKQPQETDVTEETEKINQVSKKVSDGIGDVFYDIVFFFPDSFNMKDAEKCYLTNKEKHKNEKVLFFKDLRSLNNRLDQKNETLLITSTNDLKAITGHVLENQNSISIFLIQDKKSELESELKLNRNIITIASSFDAITKSLSEYLYSKKMKYLNEKVGIKGGLHFAYKEDCIKYFCKQVIFNLFKSNKLSVQQSKDAFIHYCIDNYLNYDGIEEDLQELIECIVGDKFQNEKVIYWYSKESFFHRLINSVFRKEDISELFNIRYAINQLTDAFSKYQYEKNSDFIVYRASRINKAELALFDENASGDFYIIQSIDLNESTLKKEIAIQFGHMEREYQQENEYSILYMIKIDQKYAGKCYFIQPAAIFPSEHQIVLDFDNFIKINSVKKSEMEQFDFIVYCSITDFQEIQGKLDPNIQELTSLFDLNDKNFTVDNSYLDSFLSDLRKNNELLTLLKNTQPLDKLQESTLYNIFGTVYDSNAKYDEALKYYFRCLEIQEAAFGKNHPNTATCYSNLGGVYKNQGKYDEAFKYYFKSFEIHELVVDKNSPSTATCLNDIGGVLDIQGKHDEALGYYYKSLEIREATLGKSHPDTIISYNKIANALKNKGKYEEALKYYSNCLEIREATLDKNPQETSMSYYNIGLLHDKERKYDEALEFYYKCLEIREATLGENHPDTASCYNNIGLIYNKQGKLDKALKYYLICLEIKEASLDKNHPDMAASYNIIGEIYSKKGSLDEALKNYLSSLKIQEEIFGKNHPETEPTLNIIGALYNNKGKYDDALEYYIKSMEIIEAIHGNNKTEAANCYAYIGNVYNKQGKFDEALNYYLKSLEIREAVLDKNHQDTVTTYININNIYKNQGRYHEALKYDFKILKLKENILGKNHPDTASCYKNIGELFSKKGNLDEALNHYLKSVEILEEIYAKNHPDTATCYKSIGEVYMNQGKNDEALKYYLKSLEIIEEIFGKRYPITAASYRNIGEVYNKQGKYQEALKYYSKSHEINEAILGKNHPDTESISHAISMITDLLNSR